jgi:uncharacterized protein YceK
MTKNQRTSPLVWETGVLKQIVFILFSGVLLTLSGCGTINERNVNSQKRYNANYYFPGVQYDWEILTLKSKGSYDYTGALCYLSIVCPFVIILSMPVDLVVDSLLLHNDHQRKLIADKEFERYMLDTYCGSDGGPNEEALKRHDLDVAACPSLNN